MELENVSGFLDASGRTFYSFIAISKLLQLPWQRCNIIWSQLKTIVVAVTTWHGRHVNLVWLLW